MSICTVLTLMIASAVGASGVANATVSGSISGTAYCATATHGDTIVGIWLDVASGTDGWANITHIADDGVNWHYDLSKSTASYSLHIGCGGTPSNWYMTAYKYNITSDNTVVYCTEGDGCIFG